MKYDIKTRTYVENKDLEFFRMFKLKILLT